MHIIPTTFPFTYRPKSLLAKFSGSDEIYWAFKGMSVQAIVLEVTSSDDEEEPSITQPGRCLKRPLEPIARYDGGHDDDDDDVIVIDKLPCFVERENWRSKRGKTVTQIDDLGNDCWVLDGDPDKIVSDADACDDASEDLVVTAEKGPVACRDFPHARHLCVKFPFKSTPHEKHCGLCHCYVCDKIAPCPLWGKGNVSSDHCHSSDKEEKWRTLRNFYKRPKAPPMSLPSSFNTILSLTTMRSAVPVSRSNQSSTGLVLSLPMHVSTNATSSVMCTRPDQWSSFTPPNNLFSTHTEAVSSPGYINHMPGQNGRFGQSGARFVSPVRRNALNLGFHGQSTTTRRSLGTQLGSPEIMRRQGDSLNILLSSNIRQNALDACSTTQRQVVNMHSADQVHANDMVPRNSSTDQSFMSDEQLNKLWDFLLASDSEESNSTQTDSFRDTSINCAIEPSGSSELTSLTASQPNASGQLSSSSASSCCELQLLPMPSISEGASNSVGNAGQWPAQQMPVTSALLGTATTDQCIYTSDYQSLSLDWLNDAECPPFQADCGPLFQGQMWNYVPAQHTQPSTRTSESIGFHDNAEHNPENHDEETIMLTAQTQQPEWLTPVVALPDTQKTRGQLSSKQGFVTPQSSVGTLPCFDLRSPWEALTLGQNHSYNFECI